MAIGNILVHVNDDAAGEARVRAGAAIARATGATLTGLYVSAPYIPSSLATHTGIPVGTQPEAYTMALQVKRRQSEEGTRAKACELSFRRMAREADVEVDWYRDTDESVNAIAKHAVYADLVVAGPGDGAGADAGRHGMAGRLVTRLACPLLVLPVATPARLLGDRILVAWNPDPRAQRAVHASLPLLKRAQRVEVVTVDGHVCGARDGPPSGRAIRKYFARHAVPVDYRPITSDGNNVGATVLARAEDTDADLLVMGAYHHSPLREALLGGVTRYVLNHATRPVLIAH